MNGYAFAFHVVGSEAELGAGTGCAVSPNPKGEFVVPSSLDGRPVVGIGAYE